MPLHISRTALLSPLATYSSSTEKEAHFHSQDTKAGNSSGGGGGGGGSKGTGSESDPFWKLSSLQTRVRQWVVSRVQNIDSATITKILREEFVQVFSAADAAARQQPPRAAPAQNAPMSDRTELVLQQKQVKALNFYGIRSIGQYCAGRSYSIFASGEE